MERYKKRPLILFGIAGIIAAIAMTSVFDLMRITGTSMTPTIAEGNIILVNKIAYFYSDPEPGDIVVFDCNVYSEDGEGSVLVRRVAAAEGDRVRITDGKLYVNDELYMNPAEQNIYMDTMDETTIGRNRVFVMSDSQTAVLDSRNQAVGQLRTDELSGKVCFR